MERTRRTILAVLALWGALAAWLWPIGFGGRMPVGGDVTQFSIGLMAFLRESLQAGRLPLWNDLWGYGFPGLAESQMGVYYPPHLVLYGLLPTEAAYTASLVLHTLWAGLGTAWAARRFGASTPAAVLAAFAWAASGFFVIHLPHQWGYTVGSWMPWAFGLAWPLARGVGTPREALGLSVVLAVQTLPGHFQIAFITQVGVLLLACWGLLARLHGGRNALLGMSGIVLAVASVPLLAAAQLLPTYRLAELAEGDRTFEYLSGFAASPLHLISYVAPLLFHGSPLWRPVAWDPFHTSPEEHLAYVGLVPLLLAIGAMIRGIRRDPTTQALTLLIVATLLLSLGPYVPGFRGLIQLPGFSFFRAPARWAIATQLALVLLAARGFDGLVSATWRRAGRGLVLGGLLAGSLVAATVGLVEFALWSRSQRIDHPAAAAVEMAADLLPWRDAASFRTVLDQADRPPTNPILVNALIRRGEAPSRARLTTDRPAIYREELAPTAVTLATLVLAGLLLGQRPVWLGAALAVIAVGDLLALGHLLRPVETGPIRPLTEQSPVLAALEGQPEGTRIVSDLGNLPIVAGVAALPAYRTLDRPALPALTARATDLPRSNEPAGVRGPLRAAGVGVRVFPQRDVEALTQRGRTMDWNGRPPTQIRDPALARWVYGDRGLALLGPSVESYLLWQPEAAPSRAWFLPTPNVEERARLLAQDDAPREVLQRLESAIPLPWRSSRPERVEVAVEAPGAGFVLLSQLDDPEWSAAWITPDGREHPATLARLFGGEPHAGWQGAEVPAPGRWTLRLSYEGRAARHGLVISGLAWMVWCLAYWRWSRRPESNVGEDSLDHATSD